MMYLSRLILNPRSRQVRHELADPYEMHRTIARAFPVGGFRVDRKNSEATGVLFRVDFQPRNGIPSLLVQSQQRPDWSFLLSPDLNYLFQMEGQPMDIENPAVKQVDLGFHSGQVLAFRLRANPTKRLGKDKGEAVHKRVGLGREEEQLAWLDRKIKSAGAVLLSARTSNEEHAKGKIFLEKEDDKRMHFLSVQFDGVLKVNDPAQFLATVQAGIGSGKGMGFGLLSLAPVGG
jgi:CRISPR system Cascade subunit CasE